MKSIFRELWHLTLLTLVLLSTLAGCRQDEFFSGAYPEDWPLADLKLPARAENIRLLKANDRQMLISFEAPGEPQVVVENVARFLKDEKWHLLPQSPLDQNAELYRRTLNSLNGVIRVDLEWRVAPGQHASKDGVNDYVYSITVSGGETSALASAVSPASP